MRQTLPYALLAVAYGAPPAAAQSLQNPGFEPPTAAVPGAPTCPDIAGSLAAGWSDNSCWPGNATSRITYAQVTTGAQAGSACQEVTLDAGLVQLVQEVVLVAGRKYQASVWLRAPVALTVDLSLRDAEAPYTHHFGGRFELTPNWTRYEIEGVAPAGLAYFMLRTEVPGTFYVDEAALTSAPYTPSLPNAAVSPEFFGMHLHRSDQAWPDASLGVRGARIWDGDGAQGIGSVQWTGVHLGPGQFDWTELDAHVERATRRGADVLYVLGRTPQWASARPLEPSIFGPGQAAEPADLAYWREWVTAVGTRYRGRIRAYEIWNEPNDRNFYSGDVATLVGLAREAYTILKTIDPANVVVSPSPYELAYLERYLEQGGAAYADVVGYHFYLGPLPPEYLFTTYIPNARIVKERRGVANMPLWDTEAGWFDSAPFGAELSPALLARAYLLNWAGGAERYYYYSWDPHTVTGMDLAAPPDYRVLTSAGVAYAEVARWMRGARVVSVDVDPQGVWSMRFERGPGDAAYAVWHPLASSTQPVPFTAPTAWGARWRRTLDGVVVPLGSGAIALDARPQLLEQVTRLDARACDCGAGGPCGAGASDSGCTNSTGLGARLEARGTSVISRDDLVLEATQLPPSTFALVFMGRGVTSTPLGGGSRCVDAGFGSGIARFPVLPATATGRATLGPGIVAYSAAHLAYANAVIDAGETWRFQVWYRDTPTACGTGSNLSDVVAVTFYE